MKIVEMGAELALISIYHVGFLILQWFVGLFLYVLLIGTEHR